MLKVVKCSGAESTESISTGGNEVLPVLRKMLLFLYCLQLTVITPLCLVVMRNMVRKTGSKRKAVLALHHCYSLKLQVSLKRLDEGSIFLLEKQKSC